MILYRTAAAKDVKPIAQLHAQSWSENYRDSFSIEYLDGPVFEERLEVWKGRFNTIDPSQHTIVAEQENQLCGFVCLFTDRDPKWGTLIDNIHVSREYQGKGIGKELMVRTDEYIQQHSKINKYFLWVLTANHQAIAFYKQLGGKIESTEMMDNPGGGRSEVHRIVWEL